MIEGIDYIICPVCSKKLKSLGNHFRFSYKDIDYLDFVKNNPEVQTICQKSSERLSEHAREIWDYERKERHSARLKTCWKSDEYRDKMFTVVKENWKKL